MARLGTPQSFSNGWWLKPQRLCRLLCSRINDEGNYVLSYNGTSGASISAELEFQNIFSLNRSFGLPFKGLRRCWFINTTEITRKL